MGVKNETKNYLPITSIICGLLILLIGLAPFILTYFGLHFLFLPEKPKFFITTFPLPLAGFNIFLGIILIILNIKFFRKRFFFHGFLTKILPFILMIGVCAAIVTSFILYVVLDTGFKQYREYLHLQKYGDGVPPIPFQKESN